MTIERPRRLSPPAPIGSMLKCASDLPQRRVPRAEPSEDAAYLALVRQLPCLYCGVEPCGEAAHVKMASGAFGKPLRFGKRPEDRWALPLCSDDHLNARHAQHRQSEARFWTALGIAPLPLCEQLYAQRGELVAMKMVIVHAIMSRQKSEAAPICAGTP